MDEVVRHDRLEVQVSRLETSGQTDTTNIQRHLYLSARRGSEVYTSVLKNRTMRCKQKYIQQSMKNKQKLTEKYGNGVSSVSRAIKRNSN